MTKPKRNGPKKQAGPPNNRPSLTHFLCIPLINSTSLPQLESSLAAFKKDYPPVPLATLTRSSNQSSNDNASQPLIPQGAFRPLGSIHLTLGVMSLPTKERLDEALSFFQSIDLRDLMREAEQVVLRKHAKKASSQRPSNTDKQASNHQSTTSKGQPQPLTVSLNALHALPSAKAATILHASPVDPTERLYPFCVMLRDKFIEAGFIVAESKEKDVSPTESTQNNERTKAENQSNTAPQASSQKNAGSSTSPSKMDPYTVALTRTPKPRPLLLHATIVNTIYVRGRPSPTSADRAQGGRTRKRFEFDARDLLARYKNYYTDESRTTPVKPGSAGALSRGEGSEDSSAASATQYPFIWAEGVPLDSVCICEMGAKKLPTEGVDAETLDLNKRLGEEYAVVVSRSVL